MSDDAGTLLHWMPIVVRSDSVTEWERKFAASMVAQSRKGAFRPSQKQMGVMQRIVDEFRSEMLTDDRDEGHGLGR